MADFMMTETMPQVNMNIEDDRIDRIRSVAINDLRERLDVVEHRLLLVEESYQRSRPKGVAMDRSFAQETLQACVMKAFSAGNALGISRQFIRVFLEQECGMEDRPNTRRHLNRLLKRLIDDGKVSRAGSLLKFEGNVLADPVKDLDIELK